MNTFSIRPQILSIHKIDDFIEELSLNGDDLVIVSSNFYKKNRQKLQPAKVLNISEFNVGEPNAMHVEKMLYSVGKYCRVIGIGGGSVLDIAKLFVLSEFTSLWELFNWKCSLKKEHPLILVPTTCGTGSEVTNISILEFPEEQTKLGLADDVLFADQVYLVPEVVKELPLQVFATSSIDAFIHAIESYLSPLATPFSELFSLEAMRILLQGYQRIDKEGKSSIPELSDSFLQASCYAGIAFGNAGVGAVHALSYPLSGMYHIPHGEANYLMFLGVFKEYQYVHPNGKIKQLNEYLSKILVYEYDTVYTQIIELFKEILPMQGLRQYQITPKQIEVMSDSCINNQQRLLKNAYVSLSREHIIRIYQHSMG